MTSTGKHIQKGFTLIEILVAVSVIAILLAFGSPMLTNVGARSDIKQATDQVAQAFRTAKNAARINNSSVTLTITTAATGNTIEFNFSNDSNIADSGQRLPDIELPNKISVTGDTATFTFNSMGMINSTDCLDLASTINNDYTSAIEVKTLLGHVTATLDDDCEGAS